MTSLLSRNVASVCLLITFCFLAAGSLDTPPSSTSSSSGNSAGSSSNPTPFSEKQIVLQAVKLDHSWSSDGITMTANFKIDNPTAHSFKDYEVKCTHYAPSGTEIDSNTRVVYEVVKAHSKRSIRNFNMGFINSQAKRSGCQITDLVLLD